jgi:hypothetical protein
MKRSEMVCSKASSLKEPSAASTPRSFRSMTRTDTGVLKGSGRSGLNDTRRWNRSTGASGKKVAVKAHDARLRSIR